MAITVTIDVDGQSASVTRSNVTPQMALATLRRFVEIRGIAAEDATGAEVAQATIREWMLQTMRVIENYEISARQADVLAEIAAEYGLGDDE